MAKPILLMYLTTEEEVVERVKAFQEWQEKRFRDYHVLVVPSARKEMIEIEVHNSKNLNHKGLTELKEMVNRQLEQFNKSVKKPEEDPEEKIREKTQMEENDLPNYEKNHLH